jgi:DNA-binding response OmpR family regulator
MAHELLTEEETKAAADCATCRETGAQLRLWRVQQLGADINCAITMASKISAWVEDERQQAEAASNPTVTLVIDRDRPHEIRYYGVCINVRPAEFRLLAALATRPGKCLSWEALYAEMWGDEPLAEPGQLYSHLSRLRTKLGKQVPSVEPDKILVTVPKRGLMLNLESEAVVVE